MTNKNAQLATWWEQSISGKVASFEAIHRQLYSGLYYYLLKMLRDEDAAEDVLQDLFVKMWERKESLGLIYNVQVYFYRAARSMAINYIKRNKTVTTTEISPDIDIVFSHEEVIMLQENTSEKNRLLAHALNNLPKRQREILFLKYFDEWEYDQIAAVTGLKYQSVVNHVHRAILQLRLELVDNSQKTACKVAV